MAKKPRINLTVEQVAAIEDDLFAYYKEPIMPISHPYIGPRDMEPCMTDGHVTFGVDGAPIYRGYHDSYPGGGVKWFTIGRLGGLGTVFKVRGLKLWVEIMDIVAEQNDHGAWQWSIKLVKHNREVQ